MIKGKNKMWTHGKLNGYQYDIKHFDTGSVFGINGGRISKLTIRRVGRTGAISNDLCNYDRGWDVKPCKEVKAVYKELLKPYN